MRGGAQAHLVEAADGNHYVVKFRNNPQHRRILINEWIAARVFEQLRIHAPATAIIEFTDEFLEANPGIYIQLGMKRIAPESGWHFGSRFPGHPDRLAVYDFLPDPLLANVHNLDHFRAALVADRWLGNSDARQAVFFRAHLKELAAGTDQHPLKKAFLAQMIDHGYIFNGPHWDFADAPMHSIYFRHLVYEAVTSIDSFEPWLSQVANFPVEALDEAVRTLPPAWIDEDAPAIEKLCDTLMKRRKRIADGVKDVQRGQVNPFQNWR